MLSIGHRVLIGTAIALGAVAGPGAVAAQVPSWTACAAKHGWAVDFRGDGIPYRVEWRRCDAPRHPIDYVVVRPRHAETEAYRVDNTDDERLSHIERVEPIDFGAAGKIELLIVRKYYGTGRLWREP